MIKYESPSLHVTEHIGPLDNDQIAELSDEELEAYLREYAYSAYKQLYRANGSYILREVAGEYVLIPTGDLPGNVMITMNATCAFLWKQLQEPKTIGDLILAAKEAYDDPDGEMETHIREFIENKVKTGHIWEVK